MNIHQQEAYTIFYELLHNATTTSSSIKYDDDTSILRIDLNTEQRHIVAAFHKDKIMVCYEHRHFSSLWVEYKYSCISVKTLLSYILERSKQS
jgi:hypothetical protein